MRLTSNNTHTNATILTTHAPGVNARIFAYFAV